LRILITGGAGFIGSFLVDRFVSLGHDIRVLDNLDPQVHGGAGPSHLSSRAEFLRGDVRERAWCGRALEAAGHVINIGSGVGRRIGEVARALARLTGRPGLEPDVTGEFRRGDVRHCTADITRARLVLGFEPHTSWEAGLAELVAWARQTEAVDGFGHADAELRSRGLVTGDLGTRNVAP
jgi:nucleoside-diphosphate-sugar epimerase